MNENDVRIVRLDPMRVAASLGFGTSPESMSIDILRAWMQQTGMEKDLSAHRFFGFNNPDPTPGSPNYGYEQWITVDPESKPAGEVVVKDFSGGLFAVCRCTLRNITARWQELVAWCEDSPHRMADNLCLEECVTPQVLFFGPPSGTAFEDAAAFDLYLPIVD